MIIHHSPLDDYHTGLYNLMCDIESYVYTICESLLENYTQYTRANGFPEEWNTMSTEEWYEHYLDIEDDTSEKSMAGKAYFRIIFNWDFLEAVQEKYEYHANKFLHGAKKVWEWLDKITSRALEMFRIANKQALNLI